MTDDRPSAAPWAAVSETHSAAVFFAGDRAYKIKKPVRLEFLDFSAGRSASRCAIARARRVDGGGTPRETLATALRLLRDTSAEWTIR